MERGMLYCTGNSRKAPGIKQVRRDLKDVMESTSQAGIWQEDMACKKASTVKVFLVQARHK